MARDSRISLLKGAKVPIKGVKINRNVHKHIKNKERTTARTRRSRLTSQPWKLQRVTKVGLIRQSSVSRRITFKNTERG